MPSHVANGWRAGFSSTPLDLATLARQAALVLCLTVTASAPSADPYPGAVAEGRAAAREALAETGASSISLALADAGGVLWAEAFGLANREIGAAATPETLYAIGSSSKMLAATAVMRLVAQGRLKLDAPLVRYLPDFRMASPGYRRITVRHLLSHAAGFPGADYRNAQTTAPFPGYAAQVLATLRDARLKHAPGRLNVYCNDCFTVLESLVAAVAGRPYARFVEAEILAPLGMAHSRYPDVPLPFGTFALRYAGAVRQPPLSVNALAAGGLYSTPSDMARLAGMFLGAAWGDRQRLLSPAAVAAMAVDQTAGRLRPVVNGAFRYGLGWDSVRQPGLAAVGVRGWHKGGDAPGYGSALLLAPKEGLTVVVMGASGGFGSDQATAIAERVLWRALVERGRLRAMPRALPARPRPVVRPRHDARAAAGGDYAMNAALFRVRPAPGRSLTLSVWDPDGLAWSPWKTDLRLREDGRFATEADPTTSFSFKRAGGHQYLICHTLEGAGRYRDREAYAQRLERPAPVPDAWRARTARTWLMANEHPEADTWGAPRLRFLLADRRLLVHTAAGAQVLSTRLGDTRAGMMLRLPPMNGRDLDDAVVESRGSEEWIRLGSTLYRPLHSIPALNPADDTVALGAAGLTEWRRVTVAADTSFSLVTEGRWHLYGADWQLREDGAGTRTLTLPAGQYYLAFHAPAHIGPFPARALQALLDGSVADDGLPGVVLAVHSPHGAWVGTAGKARLDTGQAMTADMQVRLASVSKSLTAMLVMKLVESGVLGLEDTVERWLPGLLPQGERMTVRHLLSHRAGIQSLTDLESFWPELLADPRRTWTSAEVLERVRPLTPLFTPGTNFSYSNTGYYVLGMIVEAATGRPLAETLENRILGPLGLARTRLVRDGAMDEPRSHGHTWLHPTRTLIDNTDWNLSWDWTAGAAVSTGADMLDLATALFSGRIVSPATLELMQSPTEPGGYGLGLGRAPLFDTMAVGHTGENPGTVILWYHFPERDTTLFVAVNRGDTRTGPGQDVPVEGLDLAARIFSDAWRILYP